MSSAIWQSLENRLDVLRTGDANGPEFPQFLRDLGILLSSFFLSRGVQPADADALTWRTIERIVSHIELFEKRGEGSFRAWCTKVSLNVYLNWQRQQAKQGGRSIDAQEMQNVEDATPPDDEGGQDRLTRLVRNAFGCLRERDQQILEWRIIQNVDHAEIGRRLSMSTVATRKAFERAKIRLRELVEPDLNSREQ